MSGSLNRVMIIGNVCGDPEIRAIPSGAKVANFSVATNEKYKTKDGKQVDKTEFHRVIFWRGIADICENYVKKGKQIYLDGKLTTRKWTDKNGVEKYTTEIIGDTLKLLGNKGDNTGNSAPSGQENNGGHTSEGYTPSYDAEETPF